MTICDRIAVLDQGVIQQIGTPVELFDRPANRFVAQFVGSVNLYEGAIRRAPGGFVFASRELGEVALPGSLAAAEAAKVELAFRPHAVLLDSAGGSDQIQMNGVVEGGEFLGEFMRYEIRVNEAIVVADQPHLRGMERIARGSTVRLAVHPREVRLIA